jgi:hypothetical protein
VDSGLYGGKMVSISELQVFSVAFNGRNNPLGVLYEIKITTDWVGVVVTL